MLGKRQQIPGICADKGCKRHLAFSRKTDRLIIHLLDTLNALCTFLHETGIIDSFKYIIHHCRIVDYRTCQTQCRINYIIRRYRRTVRPYSRLIDMDDKIFIILCCDGIRQHPFKIQVCIQLHQRQKHQSCSVFIYLSAV